jgi:hypothetical protein
MRTSKVLIATAVISFLVFSQLAGGPVFGIEAQNQTREEIQKQEGSPDAGTSTQEQEREREELQIQDQSQESKHQYSPKNEDARKRTGNVETALENMVRIANRVKNAGVANQLHEVIQAQISAGDRVNQAIDRAEGRNTFVKFLLGPDYQNLKEVKAEMEQNRLRIQKLSQIRAQISNAGDQTELANQIAVLEEQNTALQNQLNDLVSGFSLLGWLFKLIYRY